MYFTERNRLNILNLFLVCMAIISLKISYGADPMGGILNINEVVISKFESVNFNNFSDILIQSSSNLNQQIYLYLYL